MDRFNFLFYSMLIAAPCVLSVPLFHAEQQSDESIEDFNGFDGDFLDLIDEDFYEDYLTPKNDYLYGTLDSYFCDQNHYNCVNGGVCKDKQVVNEPSFKICHCPTKYLGPKCEQSRDDISIAVRASPQFKQSFEDCMNANASDSTQHIFSQCVGSHDQDCWLRKGGKQALNCFFWVSDNALQLGVVEEYPQEKPRMQMYEEVFRKMIGKIFDEEKPTKPEGPLPVYSMQVSVYGSQQESKTYPNQSQSRYPLRISIEAPTYSSSTPYDLQLEDRNMHPGEDYSQPPDGFLSHITNPYEYVSEDGIDDQFDDLLPYGGVSESVLVDDSADLRHDETPSKKTIVQEPEDGE